MTVIVPGFLFYTAVSDIHGKGAFCRVRLKKGWQIPSFRCPPIDNHGVNHSCDPNMGHDFIILRSVLAGEELTMDYGPGSRKCNCGSKKCRGTFVG